MVLILRSGSIIAMIVVGCILLFVFVAWDTFVAKRPVIPFRFLTNRSFIGSSWIGFFDFVSQGECKMSSF